jgi:hypothetical protein
MHGPGAIRSGNEHPLPADHLRRVLSRRIPNVETWNFSTPSLTAQNNIGSIDSPRHRERIIYL